MAGNTVTLSINVESSGATNDLKVFAGKAEKSFSKVQSSIIALNQGFSLIGSGLRSLGGVYDKTIGQSIKLQKNIAEITTLLDDQGGATEQLTNEILTLQSRYGTSQENLTKAYYNAISSGAVGAADAMDLMNIASKLAIGGATNLENAVDGLTTVMNAFGKTSKDSAKISDAFFIAMKAGKTTVGELSSNIGQAAGLAASMGVKFEELLGATSALTTGGIKTSVAVTQIRAALTGLARQTPSLTGALSELGIENVQTAIKSDGFVKVLKKIIGTTDGSVQGLTELFGSVEAVNAIVGLTSETIGGKFNEIMLSMGNIAENEGATTAEAYSKMADTIDQKMSILSGKINAYFTKIGLILGKAIIPILDKISPKIDELAKDFSTLSSYIVAVYKSIKKINFDNMGKTIYAVATAVGVLTASWIAFNSSAIATSIVTLTTALAGYATAALSAASATAAVVAPYIAVLAAISGLAVAVDLLIANWSAFAKIALESLKLIGNSIEKYFLKALNFSYIAILNVAKGMNKLGAVSDKTIASMESGQESLKEAIENSNSAQDNNIKSIEDTAKAWEFSGGVAGDILNEITGFIKSFGQEIDNSTFKIGQTETAVKSLKEKVKDGLSIKVNAEVEANKGIFVRLWEEVNLGFDQLVATATKVAKGFNAITAKKNDDDVDEDKKKKKEANPLVESAETVIGAVGAGLSSLMSTFSSGAEATRTSLDQIAEIDKKIIAQQSKAKEASFAVAAARSPEDKKAAKEKLEEEKNVIKALSKEKEKAEKQQQEIAEDAGVKTVAGAVGGVVGIFSEGAGAFIGSLIELAKDPEALVSFVKNLVDQIPAIIDGIVEALPDIIDAIIEALPDIITAIIDALPTIFETLAEALPGLIVILAKGIIQLIAKLPAILFGIIKGLFKGIGGQIGADFKANFTQLFENFKQLNIKLVKAPTEFAIKLVGTIREKFGAFFEKFKELNRKFTEIPTVFVKKLIEGALSFISKLIEEIKGALPKVKGGGQIGGTLGQIGEGAKKVFKFADGGVIPQGYPNDTFPAYLSSGEVVLNKDQQSALGLDLNNQQETLNKILYAATAPIQVNATLKLNENAFADIILELNRDNRRLA